MLPPESGATPDACKRRTMQSQDPTASNLVDITLKQDAHSDEFELSEQRSFLNQFRIAPIRVTSKKSKLLSTSAQESLKKQRQPASKHQILPTKLSSNHLSTTLFVLILTALLLFASSSCLFRNELANAQTIEPQSAPATSPLAAPEETTSNVALCFGGLQTFEKISMSSFENPAASAGSGNSNANANFFGTGILIQQDDQALTSECVNLCRSQSNCLSFVIDYNKFECKSYATTQQELQQEFDAKLRAARGTTSASSNANSTTHETSSTSNSRNSTQADTAAASGYLTATSNRAHFQQLLPSASSNYFEKICLDGIANRHQLNDVCGNGRLWTIERVVDSFLDGYVEKELTNVNSKDECSKLCIFEAQFVCRSADYDQKARLCRLSKEDRRSQPQAMRYVANSNRQYLENQCATPGPSSCVYEKRKDSGIVSMDALKFAQTVQDCQMKCNQEMTFNCRSYSFFQQRCFLSGDDSYSLDANFIKLPSKNGWQFGEKKCLIELCTKGMFSYEKISGYTLRSALATPIDLMTNSGSTLGFNVVPSSSSSTIDDLDRLQSEQSQTKLGSLLPYLSAAALNNSSSSSAPPNLATMMMMMMASKGELGSGIEPLLESASSTLRNNGSAIASTKRNNLAVTSHCRQSCDLGYLNCPSFTIDYRNNRCHRLDRNSQGRHQELVARDGFAYFEKICLRVTEMMSMCQDKYWIFERVIGYELAPRLYNKMLKFVSSRRDCQEYCLEEKQFQCKSALYNDETSDCKLSASDRRLAAAENAYYKNFNNRISYLENQCIRDREPDRNCNYERAKDEPSYPTFTDHIEMVPVPSAQPLALSSSIEMEFADKSFNSSRQGVAYCEQICNDNSRFECHSFGYYSSTAQCFLSGDDTTSAGESATSPSTGFSYYEKKCNPSATSNSNEVVPPPGGTTTPGSPSASDNLGNPYFARPPHSTWQTAPAVPTATTTGPNSHTPSTPPSMAPSTDSTRPATTMYNNDNGPTSHQPATSNTNNYEPALPSASAANATSADNYKCGAGHTSVYQRVSGFEPIGGYLTLLVKDNNQPGIVAECSQLCRESFECRAFIVDYNNNQCFAMLENTSVGLLSLRQTIGKDYFEGFCLADQHLLPSANCGRKIWIIDKILDQAVVGVDPQKIIPDSDKISCRQACLEERLFWCKSAMFDSSTHECRLYSIDRESIPQMRLVFTKGVDFFENQCHIVSSSCPYDAIERGLTIVTATKSTQARSMFECEAACNAELSFNCRSYTYADQYPSLPNVCVLSSDSRSTSQRGSIQERQRTLYAERNCFYRRPRIPVQDDEYDQHQHHRHQPPLDYRNQLDRRTNPSSLLPPSRHLLPIDAGYGSMLPPSASESETALPPFAVPLDESDKVPGQACEPHQYSFERTFGYDFRNAHKERAPIAPTVGISIGCQQECMRRGDKCQSFIVEYLLPYQACYLLETQAGANKKALVKAPNSAYFEKICLPKFSGSSATSIASLPPISQPSYMDGVASDIAPSYSQDPWTLQPANQLPYHLLPRYQHFSTGKSCAKLWAFERFINYNFTAPVDKTIENVLTRANCEGHCMEETAFQCLSLTYDYSNNLCRLFKHTRRTIMSRFVDLESSTVSQLSTVAITSAVSSPTTAGSNSGTIQILPNDKVLSTDSSDAMHRSASNISTQTQTVRRTNGAQSESRQISTRSTASVLMHNIDYVENSCVPGPSSCQYRQIYDSFSQYIDKITIASSLSDCQRQCDSERLFSCRSINYDPASRNCMLINEDLVSLSRAQPGSLLPKKNTVYSEKGNCELISVHCNPQEMLVSINFDSPFRGRVLAKGNPEQCFMIGDGQTNVQFPIVFGPKCNSRQEGHNTFVNEIVIQQHPVIMTDNDKTVRVMCAFEAPEQTITLQSPASRDNKTGIDVNTPDASRTRHDKNPFSSVVSTKSAPPMVVLRILDQTGSDASLINLGDELTLKIHMQTDGQNSNSALGIFAKNLAARSSNGESLLLIDNDGCPVDHQVFPALEIDNKDGKSLQSMFKAFRFPSSGLVNFEVQIKFCPERCEPTECRKTGQRLKSLGRKKREILGARTSIIQSVQPEQALSTQNAVDAISTKMDASRAFQIIKELVLAGDSSATPPATDETTAFTAAGDLYSNPDEGGELVEKDPYAGSNANTDTHTSHGHYSSVVQPLGFVPPIYPTTSIDKSTVEIVDDKVIEAGTFASQKPNVPQTNSAPYGRMPLTETSDNYSPTKPFQPTYSPNQSDIDSNGSMPSSASDHAIDGAVVDAPKNNSTIDAQDESLTVTSNEVGSSTERSKESESDSEIPLRFSILVGGSVKPNSKWTPAAGPSRGLRRNRTRVEVDDVVVPGRSESEKVTSKSQDRLNDFQTAVINDASSFRKSAPYGYKPSSSSEEQTFDAQPSTSITSELQPASDALPDKLKALSSSTFQNQSSASSPESSLSSRGCSNQSSNNKLRLIIYTGSLVVALNVCLVVASFFIYFKRVRNQKIISNLSQGSPNQSGTHNLRNLFKSRANDQETGTNLKQHSFFFRNLSRSNFSSEMNWPNLSSSSAHSTLSSMAAPKTISTILVNHDQSDAHVRPFLDAQSSLRGPRRCNTTRNARENNDIPSYINAIDADDGSSRNSDSLREIGERHIGHAYHITPKGRWC